MKVLDLFCGGGGASLGYHRAGFEVTGVDINPTVATNYKFDFICADVLSFLRKKEHFAEFDFIHANLPYPLYPSEKDRDMVRFIVKALELSDKLFCVCSVPTAPIRRDLVLDGRMFGLKVIRNRVFQFHDEILVLHPHIAGNKTLKAKNGELVIAASNSRSKDQQKLLGFEGSLKEERMYAMGIDIPMTLKQVNKAIPPAYTNHVGIFVKNKIENGKNK